MYHPYPVLVSVLSGTAFVALAYGNMSAAHIILGALGAIVLFLLNDFAALMITGEFGFMFDVEIEDGVLYL